MKKLWILIVVLLFCQPRILLAAPAGGQLSSWKITSNLNTPRGGAAAVAHNGHLYLFGGVLISQEKQGFLASVEVADINSDGSVGKWRYLQNMKTARAFASAVYSKGYIYLIGGSNSGKWMETLKEVERAEVLKDGSLGSWESVSVMTTARRGVTAVAIDDAIYAIGGYNGIFLQTVEYARLDKAGKPGKWQVMDSAMNNSRYIHGAAADGRRIFVVGGHRQGDKNGASGSSEWADIRPDGTIQSWNRWAPLKHDRFLNGVATVGNMIVVVGGFNGEYLDSVEIAGMPAVGTESRWTNGPSLNYGRASAAVVSSGNAVYVIGGTWKNSYLDEVEYATISRQQLVH